MRGVEWHDMGRRPRRDGNGRNDLHLASMFKTARTR